MSLVDWHLQFQPLHSPVAFPLAWQSSLQVDSAAQSANCFGVSFSSEHWQSKELFTVLHSPVLRPMALQVPRGFFRVSVQGVESLWGDCRFIPADWGSQW